MIHPTGHKAQLQVYIIKLKSYETIQQLYNDEPTTKISKSII